MSILKKPRSAFEESTKPLIKYLCDNHHPRVSVIVTPTGGGLVESQLSITADEFLRD